jgi:hypothetical protein
MHQLHFSVSAMGRSRLNGPDLALKVKSNEAAKKAASGAAFFEVGGEGGIRTLGRLSPTPDFESGTFNRSATSP